jgi:hemolysin activation/secretion protein
VGSDENLSYGRIAYRVPVGPGGLAIGAAYSASRYRLGDVFEPLDVNGSARIATLFATYPLVRSSALNLTGALSTDHKTLQDRVGAVQSVTDRSVQSLTAGLVGSGTQGTLAYGFSFGYTAGKLDIETLGLRIADAASARTQGRYGKFSYAGNGAVAIAGPWSVHGAVSGQRASKNLDSSEKFSLGGADGVRAYPQGEAPGDDAYLATAELRYALRANTLGTMVLAGFIDHGGTRTNRNPFAAGDNARRLSAAGLGVNWNAPGNVLVRASIAWKLGNALPTSDTDRSARAWVQAVKYF